MYVCAGRYLREEALGKCKGKGVAHGIDEDIRNKEREGIVGHDEGAETLT